MHLHGFVVSHTTGYEQKPIPMLTVTFNFILQKILNDNISNHLQLEQFLFW